MGKSAWSGPVYGAKSLIWSAKLESQSTGSTASTLNTNIGAINVPSGEDWIITDVHVHRNATSTTSSGFLVRVIDDSTVIATVPMTSTIAGLVLGSTRVPATAGEYTGIVVASGSSLVIQLADDIATSSFVAPAAVWVYGFPRWLDTSTLGAGPGS